MSIPISISTSPISPIEDRQVNMVSTSSTAVPVSTYWSYVEGFRRLAREGRSDRLADVLLGRLDGIEQPIHDLVSPPLAHEEPDRVQALSNIFHHIERQDGPTAVRYFRQTVVEQLIQALTAKQVSSPDRLDGLERLVAYCQVVDDQQLAEQMRLSLWGILTTRFEKPFPEILSMSPEARRRAYSAFDLWLSVTPPNLAEPNCPDGLSLPLVKLIEEAFSQTYHEFLTPGISSWDHIDLLLLLYRGVMKTQPQKTGQDYFWRICKLTEGEDKVEERRKLLGRWRGLWWEYGNIFDVWPEWRSEFIRGMEKHITDDNRKEALPTNVSRCLKYLGTYGDHLTELITKADGRFHATKLREEAAQRDPGAGRSRLLRAVQ
jgi:hypothetical protein